MYSEILHEKIMEQKKNLSVIVTIYNVEPFISECIESLVKQTYSDLEIILVDDGSTDKSGEICDEYGLKHKNIQVVHQENTGVMQALYAGVCLSKGEYITFIDGDDWIKPDTYAETMKYAEQNVDIVSYGSIRYRNKGVQIYTHDRLLAGYYDKAAIEKEIIPHALFNFETKEMFDLDASICFKIMKRDIVIKNIEKAKNLQIHYGQDVAITYPALADVNNMVVLHEYYYFHRQRKNGEIAPYFLDDHYFDKLYLLYCHLRGYCDFHPSLRSQIDCFYMESVKYKNRAYRFLDVTEKYLFPFDKVQKNSKIILYGAGQVGNIYKSQVERLKYAEIVAWIDKNAKEISNVEVKSLDYINKIEYDILVIAIYRKEAIIEIEKELQSLGIDKQKIVW